MSWGQSWEASLSLNSRQAVATVLVHFYCCTFGSTCRQVRTWLRQNSIQQIGLVRVQLRRRFCFPFSPRSKHFLRLYLLLTESVPPHCSPGAKDSRRAEVSPVFLPRPSRDMHRQCSTAHLTQVSLLQRIHTSHMHICRGAAQGCGLFICRCPFPHERTVQEHCATVRSLWVAYGAHSADHFNSSTRAGGAAVPSFCEVWFRPTGCVTAILPLWCFYRHHHPLVSARRTLVIVHVKPPQSYCKKKKKNIKWNSSNDLSIISFDCNLNALWLNYMCQGRQDLSNPDHSFWLCILTKLSAFNCQVIEDLIWHPHIKQTYLTKVDNRNDNQLKRLQLLPFGSMCVCFCDLWLFPQHGWWRALQQDPGQRRPGLHRERYTVCYLCITSSPVNFFSLQI